MSSTSLGRAESRRYRFTVTLTFFTLLFVTLEARFFYLQILHGEDYRKRAHISVISTERIPARRGLIKDRNGTVLAENIASFRASVTPHYVAGDARAHVLDTVGELTQFTEDTRRDLEARIDSGLTRQKRWEPITVPGALVADTCPHDGVRLEVLEKAQHHLFCPVDGTLFGHLEKEATTCPYDGGALRWLGDGRHHGRCRRCDRHLVTEPMCPVHARPLDPLVHDLRCPICRRTFTNQVAMLKAIRFHLPGVEIHTDFRRHYPGRYDAAHLLGYMNRVTSADRKRWKGVYALQDRIGRVGIERAQEEVLRGKTGEALHVRDARGHRSSATYLESIAGDDQFTPAVSGHDVWLTLDLPLQREVRRAFRYYKSGAAVVIHPSSGAVLAMYAKPGFDPNVWSGRLSRKVWEETNANPYTPLINKAVTPYAPGSVYKIVTAVAALELGVATPETTIDCPGHYDFGGRRFHCHARSGHGALDMVNAIKHSCDVYFYRIGEMIGMDRLAEYGERFGFGAPTGIEVYERTGRVPTREWHASHSNLGWQPGFTLSTAIGQGSLTATPLQIARAFAALVNGGDVLRLRVIDSLTKANGDAILKAGRRVDRRLNVSEDILQIVREGLRRVVNDREGTAHAVALDSIVMAGKTGTAEAAQVRGGASPEVVAWLKEDHAWFAAFAPYDDPQVVVVVFVEHGGSGSKRAAPIARRIVEAWMRLGFYEAPVESPPSPLDIIPLDPEPEP